MEVGYMWTMGRVETVPNKSSPSGGDPGINFFISSMYFLFSTGEVNVKVSFRRVVPST